MLKKDRNMISQNNICGLVGYPEKNKMKFYNKNSSSLQIKENLGDAGYAAMYIIGGCIVGGVAYCFSNRQEATRSTYGSTYRSGDITNSQLKDKLTNRRQFNLLRQLDSDIRNNEQLAEDIRTGRVERESTGYGARVFSSARAKPLQSIYKEYDEKSDRLFAQRPTTSSGELTELLLGGGGAADAAAAKEKVQTILTQAAAPTSTTGQVASEVVTKDVEEGKFQQGEGVNALEKAVVDTVEGV